MGKNCDRGLENAARGRRPRAAFSSPRSQFFPIRTDPKGRHTRRDQSLRLVPATSRRDQSHRLNWPFLPQNLVAGTKIQSLRLDFEAVHTMRLVPATSRRDQLPVHTMRLVPATCCRDQSQGLVPSCVPTLRRPITFLSFFFCCKLAYKFFISGFVYAPLPLNRLRAVYSTNHSQKI